MPEATLDVPRRIDPGAHTLDLRAAGFHPVTTTLSLAPGETRSVSVELVPDPEAHVAEAAPPAPPAKSSPSRLPAILAFGAGAAGLGLGIGGALAVGSRTAALDERCSASHVCPTDMGSELRQAKTWATVSTVGFVVAGAGAVSGLVLLLVARGSDERRPVVQPTVGLGSVGVHGIF
jgi:hypothetical protein